MARKSSLFFLAKIVATLISIYFLYESNADLAFLSISALGFICIFVLQLLLQRLMNNKKISNLLIFISVSISFLLDSKNFFSLTSILIFEFLVLNIDTVAMYNIFAAIFLLLYFIISPDIKSMVITVIIILFAVYGIVILKKIDYYTNLTYTQKKELESLTKKLSDNKRLTKTLQYTAALEERNRLTARIHDKIGHGISGSIMMLEASLLTLKNDPEKAVSAIQKAVLNLRDGVDDIRMSLREERPVQSTLGLSDITAILEEFEATYNIRTSFKQNGRLDLINIEIWRCIHDNLKEALTNLLKHSNATGFNFQIIVMNKVIKIEFKDNGNTKESFHKGLGLEAIEERTIKANGRCFFNKTETGFSITNIFIL